MRNKWIMAGAVMLALGGAGSAPAATVSVTDQTLRFSAQPGERNVVAIGRDSSIVTVTDTGARLVAGNACTAVGTDTVTCEAPADTRTAVELGDRDDRLTALIAGSDVTLDAGSGDDQVTGVSAFIFGGETTLHGGSGDDRINGGYYMDNDVYGDSGDDELGNYVRSAGLLDGGSGRDRLVHHSMFGGTLRGGSGEDVLEHADAVAGVPGMDGGSGDDHLILSLPGGQVFHDGPVNGGAGSDRVSLNGMPSSIALSNRAEPGFDLTVGDDVERLHGTPGADRFLSNGTGHAIFGGDGNDRIDGGGGHDRLFGEGGDDELVGGSGGDDLHGGAGSDSVDSRDGAKDSVSCGAGFDTAITDSVDRLASADCETLAPLGRV